MSRLALSDTMDVALLIKGCVLCNIFRNRFS